MQVQRHEIEELNRCFRCDCATIECGICTWQGEPCAECFDIGTYRHRDINPDHPSLFLPIASSPVVVRDPVEIRPGGAIGEVATDGNGDCLYECVARALSTTGIHRVTIADLRAFVARCQTADTFTAYRVVSRQEDGTGYDCLRKVRSLRGLKNTIELCGAHVGADKCLWGDENAIHALSNGYRLRFVVFDSAGKIVQLVEPTEPIASKTVLLRLHRQISHCEHFNLLTFNNTTLLDQREWEWLRRKISGR